MISPGYCYAYEIYFKGCSLFFPLLEVLLLYSIISELPICRWPWICSAQYCVHSQRMRRMASWWASSSSSSYLTFTIRRRQELSPSTLTLTGIWFMAYRAEKITSGNLGFFSRLTPPLLMVWPIWYTPAGRPSLVNIRAFWLHPLASLSYCNNNIFCL